MYDISRFALSDMAECSGALRGLAQNATSMEHVSDRIVQYLYHHLSDPATGESSLALVRLFKTHPYGELGQDLQVLARGMLGAPVESPAMKCLTLLGTIGVRPEWGSRTSSVGHQAIPLPSERFVEQFPMIRQLVQQLGLEINTVVDPDPAVLVDLAQQTYNVFFVPEAVGSPYVPAQQDFVIPFGVRSVLGFGGMLPSGNLFALIMFARTTLAPRTAEMFRTLALSAKLALLPFDGRNVFS